MIVAVPALRPVTRPESLTEAMEELDELHALELAGVAVPVN